MPSLSNISVVELDFHHDSLDGFLKVFQDTEYRINVFTTSKNIALLKDISYSNNIIFYEYSGGWKYSFLKKYKDIINSCQIIFINTIANDFGAYLAIGKKNTVILRIHNVNKQFRPLSSVFMSKSWFFAWKSFSYILRQIIGKGFLFFRPLINKRVSYFTFPDSRITDYVKQNKLIEETKIILPIPLKIFIENDTSYSEYHDTLNITLIGAIDHRRRQYEQCIEALTAIFERENPPSINLTILGKSTSDYGKKVISELKNISNSRFTLKTFGSQVPETEFINCVKHSHIIISPITKNASTDIFKEIYGKTKTTGSILDFLKFGKVTLVPNHYTPPIELFDYIIKYDNSVHLAEIIIDLIKDRKINTLNQKSIQYVRENYSQESVLKKTLSIFTTIINHEQKTK